MLPRLSFQKQQQQTLAAWLVLLLLMQTSSSSSSSSRDDTPATAGTRDSNDEQAAVWGFSLDPSTTQQALQMASSYATVFGYQHSLSTGQLERALLNTGFSLRLRRLISKLQAGKQVSIGVIGGSISWGFYMKRGVNDWFALFNDWLRHAFPAATVKQKNGCVPATTAEYVSMCLDHFVDSNVDLVFMEYAINDGYTDTSVETQHAQAFERLIRKLLQLPQRPAVVLMQALAQGLYSSRGPFYWSVEDHYGVLAQYYQLPWLSLRDAMYHEVLAGQQGFTTADLYPPVEQDMQRHPSEQGHKYMADVAVALLQHVARDMLLDALPLNDAWADKLLQVPTPMFSNNYESSNVACFIGEAFPPVVKTSQHWTWKNDGTDAKPKWGFSTKIAGAWLDITLDSRILTPNSTGSSSGGGSSVEGSSSSRGASSATAATAGRRLTAADALPAQLGPLSAAAAAAAAPPHAGLSESHEEQMVDSSEIERLQQQQAEVHDEAWWEAQQAQAEEQTRSKMEEAYRGHQQGDMLVWVGYTKTWRDAGRANLTCHSGCSCQNVTVEAYHKWKTTQSFMAKVFTQQAAACTVRVTVLPQTSSGGTFFKVSGVMVTRRITDYDGSDHTDVLLLNAIEGEDFKVGG